MGVRRRLVLTALALGAAGAAAVPVPARAQGDASRATVAADGWWAATPALPTTVPEHGLGVAARAGEVDKLAAVGIDLALARGARIGELVLELREVEAPGAVVPPGATGAVVRACPITAPWAPHHNGDLALAPRHDCALASPPAVRGGDGTWRFDLSAVARRWADGSAAPHGVALVEGVDPPVHFQLSFQDRSTGTPRLRLTASAAASSPPTAVPLRPETAAPAPAPVPGRGPVADAASAVFGGADLDAPAPAPPPPAGGTAPEAGLPEGGRAPRAGTRAAPLTALPGSALLLVPALVALALGTCLVVGDERSGDEGGQRQGAVSRALSRRPDGIAAGARS